MKTLSLSPLRVRKSMQQLSQYLEGAITKERAIKERSKEITPKMEQ